MADLADVFQFVGQDLQVSLTGDLQSATAEDRSQLRVLRRLMTNPGDYIFHPGYGAGLANMIGGPVDPAKWRGVIRSQMRREPSVARSPEPKVKVQAELNGVAVEIAYVVQPSAVPVVLSFSVRP